MIDRVQWSTGAAAGSAGSATATGYSAPVNGEVLAVHVDYLDSPPATTDVTVSDEDDPSSEAIVNLANANTDVRLHPRRLVEGPDGTDATDAFDRFPVHGRLEAVIAGANAGDSVTVTAWIRR